MADLQKQTLAFEVSMLMDDLASTALEVVQRARDLMAVKLPEGVTKEMVEGLDGLLTEIGDAAIALRDASDVTALRIRRQSQGHGWALRGDK